MAKPKKTVHKTPPTVVIDDPFVPVARVVPMIPVKPPIPPGPTLPEDAGVALYKDKSGPPISTGLTEGPANLATVAEDARRTILPMET